MKITILAVGRTSTDYIARGIETYLSRLKHYVPVELTVIPDVKQSRSLTEDVQKTREGESMLAMLQPGDHVVLLDERGREMTSREFAGTVEGLMNRGLKRTVFIIGGPYGFSEAVYRRADAKLSLSRMTMTHEMVRLLFVEQVYRAMTILRGEPYHHD